MTISSPEMIFGVSRALSPEDSRSLAVFLTSAWKSQSGRTPGALQSDLASLRRFFAPTSTTRRLREEIAALPVIDIDRPRLLSSEIFLSASDRRGLVTPEGRLVLFLLDEHRDQEPLLISTEEVAWAFGVTADLYRNWSRARLLDALGHNEGALRLPVIAFNVTILVNGSIGEESALAIPTDETAERELSAVLSPVIDAFVDALHPTRKRRESFRLRGGWTLTETSRHLTAFVCSTGKGVWVRRNCSKQLMTRLARELARDRSRTKAAIDEAFRALVGAYAKARPPLASLGLAHERSTATRETRELLLAEFDKARATGTPP